MHASEEGSLLVLQSLILILTVANCSKGFNKEFPPVMLPFMIEEGFAILNKEVEKAAITFEFLKVARRSTLELHDLIKAHVSDKTVSSQAR
jgi:hypothetical protein